MVQLAITNPRRSWVIKELDKLITEWETWQRDVAGIKDHEYDKNRQLDVWADGEEIWRHIPYSK